MKKWMIVSLMMGLAFSVNAQTNITKASVLGKWVLSELEMPGVFFYSPEKDSFALGETVKAQMPDEKQREAVINMMKMQLGMLLKMSFEFKDDNTAVLNSGIQAPENATYTVDEKNSALTTTDKDDKKTTIKADILGDKLRVKTPSPQGDIMMLFKKAK